MTTNIACCLLSETGNFKEIFSKLILKTNFFFITKNVMSLCRSYCRWFMMFHWQTFRTCVSIVQYKLLDSKCWKNLQFYDKRQVSIVYSHSNNAWCGIKHTTGENLQLKQICCAVIRTAKHMFQTHDVGSRAKTFVLSSQYQNTTIFFYREEKEKNR